MYADAMTGRNGNVPLLQILMRTEVAYALLRKPLFWKDTSCNPHQEAVHPRREWILQLRVTILRAKAKQGGVEIPVMSMKLKTKRRFWGAVNECAHPLAVLVLYLQCTPSTLLFL